MGTNSILIDRQHPKITILTLNRPEKRNALNLELIKSLKQIIKETEGIKKQKILIIKGAGDAFCTGLDLKENSDPDLLDESSEELSSLFLTLSNTFLITIAAVHGNTLAGGAGIAFSCDFIIAGRETLIGFPEVRRGLVPALVMAILRRQFQEHTLKELFLIGEPMRAERAYNLNLIHKLVETGDHLKEALATASSIGKGAPSALIRTKRLLQELRPRTIEADMEAALICHKQVRAHADAKEGIQAFLERREPRWD